MTAAQMYRTFGKADRSNKADLVDIYREEMVHPTEDNRGRAELIIAKQRNGPTGTVNLVFLPQYTSFAIRQRPSARANSGVSKSEHLLVLAPTRL